MKKTFSRIAAMVAGILLLASCSNYNQISFVDSTRPDNDDDGLSLLNVNIEKMGARTILPLEWPEEFKAKLIYNLTGAVVGSYSPSIKVLETDNLYTYDEIKEGIKLRLDPTKWTLTLTAYQASAGEITALKEAKRKYEAKVEGAAKPSLSTTELTGLSAKTALQDTQTVDLTVAAANVNFILKGMPDAKGKGSANVEILFNNSADFRIKTAIMEITGDKIINGDVAALKETVTNFASAGGDDLCLLHYTRTDSVPAGTHSFTISLLDTNDVVLYKNSQDIIIEAGNTSGTKPENRIKIDKNAIGTKTKAPKNLSYKVSYEPESTGERVDIGTVGSKVYAQKSGSMPTSAKYKTTISWDDMSENEYGYWVSVTTTKSETATFKFDTTNFKNVVTEAGATGIAASVGSTLKPGTGRMSFDLDIPMGTAIKKVTVSAINPYVKTADPAELSSVSADINSELNPFGMFTVSYNINTVSNGASASPDAIVNYNNEMDGHTGSEKYFVMAYAFGTKVENLMTDSSLYPYITKEGWYFGAWQKKTAPAPTYANVMDADIEAGSTAFEHGNIELFPAWVTENKLFVSFRDYSEYRTLKSSKEYTDDDVINVKKLPTDTVTITIPAAEAPNTEIVNPVISVYRVADNTDPIYASATNPDDTTSPGTGIKLAGSTFTWDTVAFKNQYPTAAGGIYRVEISYTFNKKNDTGDQVIDTLNVTGNLFINISL